MRKTLVAATAALALIVFTACDSGSDSSSANPDGGGDGSASITGEGDATIEFGDEDGGGTVMIGGGEVPTDFPDDIPLPDDFEVTAAFSGSEKIGPNVSGVTSESVDELRSMYEQALPDAGYTITGGAGSRAVDGETVEIIFDGHGIRGGKIAISSQDFSGENSDQNSLSVAYGSGGP